MKRLALLFILLLSTSGAFAQDTAATLQLLEEDLAASLADLGQAEKTLQEKYHIQLNRLKQQAQAAGDLDQVLLVTRELQEGGIEVPARLSTFKRLQAAYRTRQQALQKELLAKQRQQLLAHRQKLIALQTKLTQDGAIEDAVLVRNAVTEVENQVRGLRSGRAPSRLPTGGRTGMPGNRRPGKLIAWGNYERGDGAVTIPDVMKELAFVKVVAAYNTWMALTADGQVYKKPYQGNPGPYDWEPAMDIAAAYRLKFGIHDQGKVSYSGEQSFLGPFPEDPAGVKQIAGGRSGHVMVFANGRALPFGNYLSAPYEDSRGILTQVVKATCGYRDFWLLKPDGTVTGGGFQGGGLRRDVSELKDIVELAAPVYADGCLFLDREGKVHGSGIGVPRAVAEREGIRRIRAGADLYAAETREGTWIAWGGKSQGATERLEQLGPLKDLALGSGWFIAIK